MRITETKINGIRNPIGFTYDFLLCSWKVEDTESKKQVHAKIEVSEDADFSQVLWEKEGAELKQSGEDRSGTKTTHNLLLSCDSNRRSRRYGCQRACIF